MMGIVRRLIKAITWKTGRLEWLYLRLCHPGGYEWAAYLKARDTFYSQGDNVYIMPGTNIREVSNPKYIRLGNNVRVAESVWICQDGSVHVVNRARGLKVDRVGFIDVRDNVFIGHEAVILPNVRIGPNAVVAAGAVVARDVPENSVVGGVPAKTLNTFDAYVERLQEDMKTLPWAQLIAQRAGEFDAAMEPELERLRLRHFFGSERPGGSAR